MDGSNALALAEQHGHVEAAQFLRAYDGGILIKKAFPMPADRTQPRADYREESYLVSMDSTHIARKELRYLPVG